MISRISFAILLAAHFRLDVSADISSRTCQQSLRGAWVGGSCFFMVDLETDYTSAWNACNQNGGVLAQIHTSAEFTAVEQMLDTYYKQACAWVALQHSSQASGACALPLTITYWYDGPDHPNMRLVAKDTWIRAHQCDDVSTGPQEVVVSIMPHNVGTTAADSSYPFIFLDHGPVVPQRKPLCQIKSTAQQYTQIPGKCLSEPPVETYTPMDPQICADVCSWRLWCRSYELRTDCSGQQVTCSLFSWSLSDTNCSGVACPKSAAAGSNCFHYDCQL